VKIIKYQNPICYLERDSAHPIYRSFGVTIGRSANQGTPRASSLSTVVPEDVDQTLLMTGSEMGR
jgi:hypothetical protein